MKITDEEMKNALNTIIEGCEQQDDCMSCPIEWQCNRMVADQTRPNGVGQVPKVPRAGEKYYYADSLGVAIGKTMSYDLLDEINTSTHNYFPTTWQAKQYAEDMKGMWPIIFETVHHEYLRMKRDNRRRAIKKMKHHGIPLTAFDGRGDPYDPKNK